ncbi:C40 family peptidase [Allosaccharopolyspora coralli]|uniref:C40 family peptidase n=1 Tax=Allosaccharopolyspora coralli TaxID=2665642 RepID=UPI001E297625|nr:NlpC/P60 family protein [Allosaccharopolyspora coralli]
MASHRLKRSMRGALAATAVAAVVGITATPASADPPLPDNASDAVKQLSDLQHEAEVLTEEYKKAEDDRAARQADLDRANADADQAQQVAESARAEEDRFRGQVDQLTSASYQGARMNKMSALLVSESPNDFLDRASALDVLAKDNNEAVTSLAAAADQAEAAEQRTQDARARAAEAEAEAARIQDEIGSKKAAMEDQISVVKDRLDELSAADRETLTGGGQTDYEAPAGTGAAAEAVQAALSVQGSPYVWGAKGPSSFDCSGLTYWAYEQAGVTLGGSTKTQVNEGKSISAGQLQPGDLIFYNSPVSHVSMYVGNGKAVHAPTSGDVVKVDEYKDIGDVTSMRRPTA